MKIYAHWQVITRFNISRIRSWDKASRSIIWVNFYWKIIINLCKTQVFSWWNSLYVLKINLIIITSYWFLNTFDWLAFDFENWVRCKQDFELIWVLAELLNENGLQTTFSNPIIIILVDDFSFDWLAEARLFVNLDLKEYRNFYWFFIWIVFKHFFFEIDFDIFVNRNLFTVSCRCKWWKSDNLLMVFFELSKFFLVER